MIHFPILYKIACGQIVDLAIIDNNFELNCSISILIESFRNQFCVCGNHHHKYKLIYAPN